MKYEGRTFIVSGGASGLGRACVVDICGGGGQALVLDLDATLGAALVEELGGPDAPARFCECDVTDAVSIYEAVAVAARWAAETDRPLGGVIAAAGVATAGLIIDKYQEPHPLYEFDNVIAVNLRGTFDLVRQALPLLVSAPIPAAAATPTRTTTTTPPPSPPGSPLLGPSSSSPSTPAPPATDAAELGEPELDEPELGEPEPDEPEPDAPVPDAERGVVIMVASAAALEGQRGQVAYAASKGGVAAMTLPMARDLARYGIRVVTIAPGPFDTAMSSEMSSKVKESLEEAMLFPQRPGRPDEFAALVRHAMENSMLNGVVMRIDGGIRLPSKM